MGEVEVVDAEASTGAQRRVAAALRAGGLVPGDRLALLLPGSADYLAVVLGALRTGVVPVPLDPGLTAGERDRLLADAEPALVVDDPHQVAELVEGPGECDLADVPLARPMHYTSGTTGRPKGVWSGVLDEPAAAALAGEEREQWGLAASDRHLVLAPLHHSAPLRFATASLLAGGTVVLPGRFDPRRALDAVRRHRPTTTFAAPVHLRRLLAALGGPPGALLGCFRLVAHAGAPCPPPVKRRALEAFPAGSVWEFYGSTEGQVTVCSPQEWLARPGTVGRPRRGRTVRVDDDGAVWCAVPAYARFSYWRDPAKTERAWDGDAFTVGDLGRLDADGYLWLDGRRDDLVISGGVNVYPLEVEGVLGECPGVEEAAVFGVDDERWGQRVEAAVVGSTDPDAVLAWARDRLAPAKRPKRVHVVESLPRTPSGKVRRLDLAQLLG